MLKDIIPPKETITFPGGSFELHGLSLEEITALLAPHTEEISGLFSGKTSVQELLIQSPVVAAAMVAYAAGEPDMVETVRRLPFSVQLEALEAVWDLTVLDPASLVKSLRTLVLGVNEVARHAALIGKTS